MAGKPKFYKNPKSRGGRTAGPNPTINDIQSAGAMLELVDSSGNPITTQPAPQDVSVSWTSSDDSILSVTQDATNPMSAQVSSHGKVGNGVVISATVTLTAGTSGPFNASLAIDVPAGPPASAQIILGVPTP